MARHTTNSIKVPGEASEESKASQNYWPAPRGGMIVVGMLLVFVGFAIWATVDAAGEAGASRPFIFGSVQALAAVALGWYFGSAVQSERVANAEAEALRASRDAENGRALAALILSREGRVVENSADTTLAGVESKDDERLRREYADAARRLFPFALSRTKPTDAFGSEAS